MHRWKWVVVLTLVALTGLIVGLSRLARNQQQHPLSTSANDAGAPISSNAVQTPDGGITAASPPEGREPTGTDTHAAVLPASAPNDVTFGAILITFEGVQGAPAKARTKAAALELAQRILPAAQENFESAVKQGDPGSTANAGTIRRGVLEPAVEYALFTLEKGAVYPSPIETPRGYWIMRRIR